MHSHNRENRFMVGLDVGSTTVKAVVLNAATDEILWQDYQRHETKQPEKTLEFLRRIETEVGVNSRNTRMFVTGSGGGVLAELVGAKFVQEVTAVALAVEKQHPEVYSVIELGGQDAKIIVFKDDNESGRKKKIPSMNDKCAGGTGAVIDKINGKLKIPVEELSEQGYHGIKLHKVAGKCGVFAETDINSLQKVGTPPDQLMASLFDAIVLQNLSVLTRGHTLRPHVLLLGGPNTFIRGMREAWQANIPRMWEERKVEVPAGSKPEELIKVPQNAQYFAALGAIEFGKGEEDCVGCYHGFDKLIHYIDFGRQEEKAKAGGSGLVKSDDELAIFREQYRRKKFIPATFQKGQTVGGFVGIDGGSTSTKAVLLDEEGTILCKSYQLSNGNPIQDTIEMFENLRGQVEAQGAKLEVLGVATTGYAKDILKDVLKADVGLVETVAHTESALKFYEDPHVIVDVGGQDIKLIILKDGRVKDFKLNTQCSAGNGYFLQSTAEGFGLKVEDFADLAFGAQSMPLFGYGCAVFMQSDIVNFQRQGWQAQEILAGLAAVLPKNVFLYVASIPNLAALGLAFRAAGRHAEQSGRGEGRGGFHPQQLPRGRQAARDHRPRALRRIRRDWRGRGSGAPVAQRHAHHVHRARRGPQNRIPHHPQRRHPLQLLQEHLPAHVHRHQDRHADAPARDSGQEKSHQGAAAGQRATVDHRHLRKGHGGRRERHEGHQGRPRPDQGRQSQLRRHGRARGVPPAELKGRRRSDPIARLDEGRQGTHRTHGSAPGDPHRHPARAERLCVRTALQRVFREPRRAAGEYRVLRLHHARALSRGIEPRGHRPVLPGEDRHPARLQPDPGEAPQEAARRDFLPHGRRAAFAAREAHREPTPAPR